MSIEYASTPFTDPVMVAFISVRSGGPDRNSERKMLFSVNSSPGRENEMNDICSDATFTEPLVGRHKSPDVTACQKLNGAPLQLKPAYPLASKPDAFSKSMT